MNTRKRSNIFMTVLVTSIIISMAFIGCDSSVGSQSPEVQSTSPTNAATGVSINGTVTATFVSAVDSTSITATTFTVSAGGSDIAGTVTYDVPNKIAIFTPSLNLVNSTEYTATLTTGVMTLDNLPMSQANVWTFTTAAAGVGPTPVNLGTAANYVILAKTGVSTVPNSVITGDVGLSPAATSFATGFSETAATGYATSAQITGNLYAANMADPTPINLTTAVSDMHTAYTDAAGRSLPDFTNLGSGAIGSLTLTPGLYIWTSSVNAASNLTIAGGANDTWIFQVTGDLSVASDVIITLTGGAQAKNIVWQVAGTVNLGARSNTKGIILGETSITLGTGATINGRLLAQTAVALDQATVTNSGL